MAKTTNIENLKQSKRLYKRLEIKPRKVKKAPVKYCQPDKMTHTHNVFGRSGVATISVNGQ